LYQVTGNKRFWGGRVLFLGVEVVPVGLVARRWFDLPSFTILVVATGDSVNFLV